MSNSRRLKCNSLYWRMFTKIFGEEHSFFQNSLYSITLYTKIKLNCCLAEEKEKYFGIQYKTFALCPIFSVCPSLSVPSYLVTT